jgi:GNAT superfamily N-acetyltransferase
VIREVASEADLEAWVDVKNAVVPNEPTNVEQMNAAATETRTLLLAHADGRAAGCAIVDLSNFGGEAFMAVRVLPEFRRRGIGRALAEEAAQHARALGRDGVNCFVYADEPHSIAFAESYGLANVDYQLEQVRVIGDEPPPPDGYDLRPLADDREALLERVWDEVAEASYLDLPLPGEVTYPRDEFLREEATRPDGSFVALDGDAIVGYAGLMAHANGDATAEHGLTAVRRDRRRRGIGRALKLAQLHWASQNGIVELVTWTQKGNEAMQKLNRGIGYRDMSKVITYQGPLP